MKSGKEGKKERHRKKKKERELMEEKSRKGGGRGCGYERGSRGHVVTSQMKGREKDKTQMMQIPDSSINVFLSLIPSVLFPVSRSGTLNQQTILASFRVPFLS